MKKPTLKNRLLLIGPKTGETVMGVSVAFDMICDYVNEIGGETKVVNLTQPGATSSAGQFRWGRTFFTLSRIVEAWFKMLSVNQIYLIVSTSLFGFVKDFLIILGAWLLRKKVVVHLHGGGYRLFYEQRSSFGKWVIRWTLRRTNRIIVLGELLRAQFDFLDSPERIAVVPNGMAQLSSRSTSSDPKSAPGPNEPWRFLYLSNLMETKGYFVLMEACELLSQGSKNFQADFCGAFVESSAETGGASTADQLQSNFMRRINEAPLSEQLTYRGTVSGKQKEDLLENAHVLILPTWYPWEGQPLSIIEAMACGTPVISTEHAGIPEEIVHGETGWMLKKGQIDKDHLSETLATLMDMSAEEYSEMSKRAHQFYLDHFTKEKHLNNMLKVINSV